MTRGSRIALVIVALLVAAGAGAWFIVRRNDPLNRAEAFIARGDLRSAQVELRNALRKTPRDAATHLRMARLQMKLADPVAAEKEFKQASAFGADRWEVITELGEATLAQGQNYETLDIVPARGPTPEITARLLLLRSIAQIGLKDLRAANRTLSEAQAAAPGRPETALIAARVAATQNDLAGTQAKVDEVLRADPKQVEALLMQERLLTAAGKRPEALSFANRAVQSAPWSAMARMALANQLIFANQDAKAQENVDAVLSVQPRFLEGIYLNAVLMARRGKYQDASVELAKLEGSASRFPQALYYQSLVAINLGQNESAAEGARRYSALVPNDPDGLRLVGRTELATRHPDRALAVLQRLAAAGHEDPETLDLLGRAQAALGNTPAAMDAFAKAATLAPNDPAILAHLGQSQLQLGRAAEATASLEKSVLISPGLQSATATLVAAALDAGDLPKAEAALARLRGQAGQTEAVAILTGMIKLRRNDLDGAAAAFTEAVRAFPASIDARLQLARTMIRQGRRRPGLSLMSDILARDPTNIPTLNSYLPLLLEDQTLPPAIQALEAAHKAEPRTVPFTVMLADAHILAGNARQAITLVNDSRGSDPRNKDSLHPALLGALGRAQTMAGQLDEAIATYREQLAATPSDLVARGALLDLLMQRKQPDAARALLQESVAVAPGNPRLMGTLVSIEAQTAGLDAAIRAAEALRREPRNMPYAAALKGDLLMRAGRPADAAQAFEGEYRASPIPALLIKLAAARIAAGQDDLAATELRAAVDGPAAPPEIAQSLAQLDIKARRWTDAQTHLAQVLRARPDDALALNNLAWTYLMTNDARARPTAQQAYLRAPTPDAADTLAWIMVKEGAPKPALPLLQRASEQRPGDRSIRWHLAVALKDNGQPAEAAQLLKNLLADPDPFDDRAAAQAMLQTIDK